MYISNIDTLSRCFAFFLRISIISSEVILVVAHKTQVTRGRRVLRKRLVLALLAASLKQLGNIQLCAIYAEAYVISLGNRRVELANCTELYVACIDISAPARVICFVVLDRNKSRVNYQDIQQLLKRALDGEEILVGTVSTLPRTSVR